MIIFHSNESFLLASFLLPKTRDKKERMAAKYAITRGLGKLRDFIKSFCGQRCWYAEVACWTVGVVECGGSETKGRCGSMLLFCRHSWPQLASYTSHNIAHRRILYTSREQSWSMWHWSRNVKHWPYSPFSNPEFLPFNSFVAWVGNY